MSLIFGILLYISDKTKVKKKIEVHNLTTKSISNYRFISSISLIPGVSRSGITITSGRILGFDRFDSAKISFFLAIHL